MGRASGSGREVDKNPFIQVAMFRLDSPAQHQEVVGEVVRGWRGEQPDTCLLSREGHVIYTQRTLLALHSPLLSSLLAEPSHPPPLPPLSLPLSSSSLTHL